MTVKKYELTDDTIELVDRCVVHRIRALVDIPAIGVSAGDFGGYMKSESNLSHEGNCWVGINAVVSGNAVVEDRARVKGNAVMKDNAVAET